MRTRYFDDWAMDSVRRAGVRQPILLGAGMDIRAFRLPWPDDLRSWEIDTHDLLSLKETCLRAAGASFVSSTKAKS